MNMNIFDRKNREQVHVPEIEVRGDEVEVEERSPGEPQASDDETRRFKLPKTKWF